MFTKNDANTITHPHPPSGAMWEKEAVEEDEEEEEEEDSDESVAVVNLDARDAEDIFE